jgi:hypothetical protein
MNSKNILQYNRGLSKRLHVTTHWSSLKMCPGVPFDHKIHVGQIADKTAQKFANQASHRAKLTSLLSAEGAERLKSFIWAIMHQLADRLTSDSSSLLPLLTCIRLRNHHSVPMFSAQRSTLTSCRQEQFSSDFRPLVRSVCILFVDYVSTFDRITDFREPESACAPSAFMINALSLDLIPMCFSQKKNIWQEE